MNNYQILGLRANASPEVIKAAYRKLVMKYHPDKGGSNQMFMKIQTAYDELNKGITGVQDVPDYSRSTSRTTKKRSTTYRFIISKVQRHKDLSISLHIEIDNIDSVNLEHSYITWNFSGRTGSYFIQIPRKILKDLNYKLTFELNNYGVGYAYRTIHIKKPTFKQRLKRRFNL